MWCVQFSAHVRQVIENARARVAHLIHLFASRTILRTWWMRVCMFFGAHVDPGVWFTSHGCAATEIAWWSKTQVSKRFEDEFGGRLLWKCYRWIGTFIKDVTIGLNLKYIHFIEHLNFMIILFVIKLPILSKKRPTQFVFVSAQLETLFCTNDHALLSILYFDKVLNL